ncbi:MAG: YceI family protein [Granulosicoccus sp.]
MALLIKHALAATALFGTMSGHAADLSAVPSGGYVVDPTHAFINFSYNHLGLSNPTLGFDDFSIDMNLDAEDPTKSMLSVNIDPDSVIAGSDKWHEHLTGPDFFDIANNPEITFQSTSIEAAADGRYKVNGDLTIKGQSKPVSLDVTINAAMMHPMSGKPVIGLSASTTVLRSDFGLDKFVPNISDEVQLNIQTELAKAE